MATNKTNFKLQKHLKSGIKNETIELLKSYAKTKFQKMAEEEEKKKHLIGAENLLAFCEMAIYKPVEQPESDNSDDSNHKIALHDLNQNESASNTSSSLSASECSSSLVLTEVIQLLVNLKRLHPLTAKFHEPETSKTISNVATHSNLSLEWSKLQREYPDFKNANIVTESQKRLILRFIYRLKENPFKPGPRSTRAKTIKLKECYDNIFRNNMIRKRRRIFYFLCNTYTCKWTIHVVNKELNYFRQPRQFLKTATSCFS